MHQSTRARPLQAALASAASFAAGAMLPLLLAIFTPLAWFNLGVPAGSLLALGVLGAFGARIGGAAIARATVRVMFWGVCAMVLTYAAGRLFGAAG